MQLIDTKMILNLYIVEVNFIDDGSYQGSREEISHRIGSYNIFMNGNDAMFLNGDKYVEWKVLWGKINETYDFNINFITYGTKRYRLVMSITLDGKMVENLDTNQTDGRFTFLIRSLKDAEPLGWRDISYAIRRILFAYTYKKIASNPYTDYMVMEVYDQNNKLIGYTTINGYKELKKIKENYSNVSIYNYT